MDRDKIRRRLRNNMTAVREATPWYLIRNAAGDGGQPAEIYIYDEIGWLGHTAQDFINQLKGITATEITMRINSPGGEIFDGIAIYNSIRDHPAHVTAHVDSLAASIASVILQAADDRVMQPFSQVMIHDGSGLCVGDAADMMQMAGLLDRQSDNIAGIYNDRTGGGQKTWRARMQAETWYTAEEAVAAGLADRVAKPARQEAPPEDQADRMAARFDLSLFNYGGRAEAPAPQLTAQAETPAVEDAATECPDCGQLVPDGDMPAHRQAEHGGDGGDQPTDELKHCPECDQMVAESAMDDHRAAEHGVAKAEDVADVLAQLTPPTGILRAALEAGAADAFEWDSDGFRATLRTLVAEAAAEPPKAETIELTDETCPSCGATALPNAKECSDCGAPLSDAEPEPAEAPPGDTLAETIATVAAQAPAVPAPAPEPEPEPATQWRAPEAPPEQTVPRDAWSDVGQTIAAAIRIQANNAAAPATAAPEPAPEIEPLPDTVLLARAIREEARRPAMAT